MGMPRSSDAIILRALHHIGALPLAELERRFTKPAVDYVRNRKLIAPTPDEGGGQLYRPTGAGRTRLGLSRSYVNTPHVTTESFFRQAAHAYLETLGLYYTWPTSNHPNAHRLGKSQVRRYWNFEENATYYRVLAGMPHTPVPTVKRTGLEHTELLWLFAESPLPYRSLDHTDFWGREQLRITTWAEVRPTLSRSMLNTFDRLHKLKLGLTPA